MSLTVADHAGSNVVFLFGAPRSGTTWLQRLLASHPRIKTGQESNLFEYIGTSLRIWKRHKKNQDRGGIGLPCYLTEDEFIATLKKYLEMLLAAMFREMEPGDIFLDKTPGHALWVPEILELMPQAKFLHLIRDPRDVVASLLAASRGWGSRFAPRRASRAAILWVQHVRAARKVATQMPSGQYLDLFYEDLCREPLSTLETIFQFLKMPLTHEQIESAIRANAPEELRKQKGTPIPIRGEHGKDSPGVVREPEDFIRKARPGSWHEDLTFLERLEITRALRREMPDWKNYAKT